MRLIVSALLCLLLAPYAYVNAAYRIAAAPSINPALLGAFQWLRLNTPEPDGLWTGAEPPWRVMCSWETGWWVLDRAQRAPVANPGGEGIMAEYAFFYRADWERSRQIAREQHARYVLVEAPQGRASRGMRAMGIAVPYLNTMHAVLWLGPGPPGFVCRWQSPQCVKTEYGTVAMVKVYEIIE